MAEAALLGLPYPESATIAEATLESQTQAIETALPERPVVLGGCCCAHIGAVRGLGRRGGRLGVVWFDAHGDLNTPETSPSGNLWGMPLRMLIDAGVVAAEDVALVGARNLDPGERDFMARTGIDDSFDRALAGVDSVYVALDVDVLDPAEIAAFMPEPNGLSAGAVGATLAELAQRTNVAGIGVTGLTSDHSNMPVVTRLLAAAGF